MDILGKIGAAIRGAQEEGIEDVDVLVTFAVESCYTGCEDFDELRYYAECYLGEHD